MNNFATKVLLLLTLLTVVSGPIWASFDFLQLAKDLESHNNKIQFSAKKELREYDDLEALLKQKLDKEEDLATVIKVIRVIHVKTLLGDLIKNAKKWANLGVYSTINTLTDKESRPLVLKFYDEQIKKIGAGDTFLKNGYVDFYEYNNLKVDFNLLMTFLEDDSYDLRVKVAQYFYSVKEKYLIWDVNNFSNKALGLGPYQLRLEVLETLSRLSKSEIRKFKIDTNKCKNDLNEKIKKACKNVRKYLI